MLRQFTEYSKADQICLIWRGLASVVEESYKCQQEYLTYKEKGNAELSIEKEIEMIILELLEALGYDFGEIGTYLYKEVIIKITNYLSNEKDRNDIVFCKNLIVKLQNAYSQFYFDLARNDRDIGTKTFHEYINKAHEKRDIAKIPTELLVRVYGFYSKELDFGEQAFLLGNYIANNLLPVKKDSPKEKKLISCEYVYS